MKHHHYKTTIEWTGNKGSGTSNYRDYERSHTISVENKPVIEGSSDPAFRGDKAKYNPEEMLLSSLSSCHMLWYLHFCSETGIIVTGYIDSAIGTMEETANGSGHFTEAILNPVVTITDEKQIKKAEELHEKANQFCFIANSVNFPVKHIPKILIKK